MKQVIFNAYGSANVLEVTTADKPVPGKGEVRIQVEAAGVNYSDILRRRNTYFMPTPLPYVLGAEVVGRVDAFGEFENTPTLSIGDRVLAILPYGGGYAEYACANAQYCIPLPPSIDSPAATALFVQGSTAQLMINRLPSLEGKTVLVHAAAGGVGSLLVQLAQLKGATVIGTASSEKKRAYVQSLGAMQGVNYTEGGWPEAVVEANQGEGVDVIFEMVGGSVFADSFKCLKPGGTMMVYGAASGKKGMIHSEHYVDESISLQGFNLAHAMQHQFQDWQQAIGEVIQAVASGQVQVGTTDAFPLEEARKAHQAIEDRQTTGKVVLLGV